MNIIQENQYNQGISKYKLLSSTAGVGSIITTKMGYYILVSDINKWQFIKRAQNEIQRIRSESKETEWYHISRRRISGLGLSAVDDRRFIEFLKKEKELSNLLCLIRIPHLSINEHFNTINVKNNPVIQALKDKGENVSVKDFMVIGSHFPKWFRNRLGLLKTYNEWLDRWRAEGIKFKFFAPPRDAKDPIKSNGKKVTKKVKDSDGIIEEVTLYRELTQNNMVLICPNGHLSDIPWSKYLRWKLERKGNKDKGENLFELEECCPKPNLKWSESTTRSEGYSSIFIECLNCNTKTNLEGINNISPRCIGEKPWEIDHTQNDYHNPRDDKRCRDIAGRTINMQTALVTGNNVYFANNFSSLYVPKYLAENIDEQLLSALDICEEKYKKLIGSRFEKPKKEWFEVEVNEKFLFENSIEIDDSENFIKELEGLFLNEPNHEELEIDPHEYYRWQEYRCFKNHAVSPPEVEGLIFKDIELSDHHSEYFNKIQQIDELKISTVQLDFTRVKPNERIRLDGKIVNTTDGKETFSIEKEEVFVLPANETFGEGLFFDFNELNLAKWADDNQVINRFQKLIKNVEESSQGAPIRQRLEYNGVRHLLVHTFSHLLMRELEFSCGYPTASLKERLYISPDMAGVLIYTAEGAEGSMGGLVWQGQPDNIFELVKKAMTRAYDCSSDPLCWESDGQGIFNLNLAGCFSCSLVSETACEERNLGIDRRMLVDTDFGYFKELL